LAKREEKKRKGGKRRGRSLICSVMWGVLAFGLTLFAALRKEKEE